MSYVFDFAISSTKNDKVNSDELTLEIQKSNISVALDSGGILTSGNSVMLSFAAPLSADDQATLVSLLHAHEGNAPPPAAQTTPVTLLGAPQTSDGRYRFTAEKPLITRTNFYTHNFCDPTTWAEQSVAVTGETPKPMPDADGSTYTYALAHPNVIDLCHGKQILEDWVTDAAGNSCLMTVTKNGAVLKEAAPFGISAVANSNDYSVDYAKGLIHFTQATTSADVILVNYHYANGSQFTIKPYPGKKLTLGQAKILFSVADFEMTTAVCFDVYGLADVFASAAVQAGKIPSGTKIEIQPFKYKTMADFLVDAHDVNIENPAFGSGPRSAPQTCSFEWDYVASSQLHSSMGMELRLRLEGDIPITGSKAVATFYCMTETEDA